MRSALNGKRIFDGLNKNNNIWIRIQPAKYGEIDPQKEPTIRNANRGQKTTMEDFTLIQNHISKNIGDGKDTNI